MVLRVYLVWVQYGAVEESSATQPHKRIRKGNDLQEVQGELVLVEEVVTFPVPYLKDLGRLEEETFLFWATLARQVVVRRLLDHLDTLREADPHGEALGQRPLALACYPFHLEVVVALFLVECCQSHSEDDNYRLMRLSWLPFDRPAPPEVVSLARAHFDTGPPIDWAGHLSAHHIFGRPLREEVRFLQ